MSTNMENESTQKVKTAKTTVMTRIELPKRWHKALKKVNKARPKQTVANTAESLIIEALSKLNQV